MPEQQRPLLFVIRVIHRVIHLMSIMSHPVKHKLLLHAHLCFTLAALGLAIIVGFRMSQAAMETK